MPVVASTKLRNIIDALYSGTKNPERVGTGTTADAVRFEIRTGEQVHGKFHTLKPTQRLTGLEKWLKANPNAPQHDRLVAQSLADELINALGGG